MKIVFLDGHTLQTPDHALQKLESYGSLVVYDRTASSQIVERSKDADILIVNKTPLTSEVLLQLPQLKLICIAATGYDKVDIGYARKRNIPVCNCANYSTRAVAQMALSLLLEATDHVGFYTEKNLQGQWSKSHDFCYSLRQRYDLEGKRLAIVGFGNIGRAFAQTMNALGVMVYAVTSKAASALPSYVNAINIDDAFATCDIVSLNCPLTLDNKAFVNSELLKRTKKGLILVNTARGGLINENDVADALKDGTLGAYCTDVLGQEPPKADCPLFDAPNVYITPHIGWRTPQTVERIINILAQNIESFLAGQPQSVVNIRE